MDNLCCSCNDVIPFAEHRYNVIGITTKDLESKLDQIISTLIEPLFTSEFNKVISPVALLILIVDSPSYKPKHYRWCLSCLRGSILFPHLLTDAMLKSEGVEKSTPSLTS